MNVPVKLDFSRSQLQLIKNTYAKDCNDQEFSLFVEMARARGLNPLLKHIYAMVLNKDSKDPNKPRQLTLIVSIDGQRTIANSTKDYRPDDRPPRFVVDDDLRDPQTNPQGLISCEVAVYVHRHGEWFPVPAVAYWEEFAPLVEQWAEDSTGQRRPTGKFILDPRKGNWRRMPRVMLAKVAEMQALRKAFPDGFSNLYAEEEIDKSHSIDLTASEILEQARAEDRQRAVGGVGIILDWMAGGPLEKVPMGRVHDRIMGWVKEVGPTALTIHKFKERNRDSLREYWNFNEGDGHALAEELEKAMDAARAREPEPEIIAEPVIAKKKPAAKPKAPEKPQGSLVVPGRPNPDEPKPKLILPALKLKEPVK